MIWRSIIVSALFCFCLISHAQVLPKKEKKKNLRVNAAALPARSPEYGWYVEGGAVGIYSTKKEDTLLRKSNTFLFLLLSQYKQYMFSSGSQIFTPKETFFIGNKSYFSYMPTRFFPLNEKTTEENSELITSRISHVDLTVLRKLQGYLYGGIRSDVENHESVEFPHYGVFDQEPIRGKDGYFLYGAGLNLRYDSRNDLLWPSKGIYVDVLLNQFFSGSYTFFKPMAEFCYFKGDLVSENDILGFKLAWSGINKRDVYYRYWPSVTSRAFHPNMLKFMQVYEGIVDYQFPIWMAFNASLFYEPSVGVSGDENYLFHSYGGGLRILLSAKDMLYVRAEYAFSETTHNFHFSFAGAF